MPSLADPEALAYARERVAKTAESMVGNQDYQKSDPEPRVGGRRAGLRRLFGLSPPSDAGVGSAKCNFFIYDVLRKAGTPQTRVNGRPRIALAEDWSDRRNKIDGYRPLNPSEQPLPGDVVANGRHAGIVIRSPTGKDAAGHWVGGASASAADPDHGDRVTSVPYGFRQEDHPERVVFWRWIGPPERKVPRSP